MTIANLFQRDVDVAKPGEPVQVAAKRMSDRKIGALVLVDDDRKPVGVVTDRDLTVRVLGEGRDPYATAVGDVMTSYPQSVSEFTTVEEALGLMRSHAVRRLPVVRSDGVLAGIISVDDIMRRLFDELGDVSGLLAKVAPHGGVPAV